MTYPISDYPTSKDTFSTKRFKQDVNKSDDINFLQSAVRAIQDALGTTPQGTQADVKTLLQRCLATNGAMRQGTGFPSSPNEGDFFYRTDQDIVYVYDGSSWDAQSGISNYAAGDYLISGPGILKINYVPGTSYVKIDEFYVPRAGTLRIKFWLRWNQINPGAWGRIYRNGVAVGTERNNDTTTETEYSEDISGWSAGDLCQLYVKGGVSGSAIDVGAMRIYENVPVKEIPSSSTPKIYWGTGLVPSWIGVQGDLYLRQDGSTSTTLYVHTGGGWTAK